ncbi:MAG: RIP metalloprotease RseP [Pseudomonadota bacterium]
MSGLLQSIIFFIVTLGLLITVHEFGHYWVARKMGVKVLRFSIGFGKILWSRRAGPDNTEYAVAALPLGGYVKMLDEQEGAVPQAELPRAFNRQKLAARSAIVFAGPLFNFLFAILAYWLMFVVGVQGLKPLVGEVTEGSIAAQAGLRSGDEIVAVDRQPTPTWEAAVFALIDKVLEREPVTLTVRDQEQVEHTVTLDLADSPAGLDRGNVLENLGLRPLRPTLAPVIGQLEGGGAAERAGLAVGDRIVAADGQPFDDWNAWAAYVREHAGQVMRVEVERAGRTIGLELRPAPHTTPDGAVIGRIGAAPAIPQALPETMFTELRYGPVAALGQAFAQSWEVAALTVNMLGKMVIGQAALDNVSGPISIAQFAGDSASDGLAPFLRFLAIVSISLGILNLLPVPLLDGGHLMYYLIEAVKGSPVSAKAQMIGQQLGIIMLLGLTILAFYNDLVRLFGAHS